MKLCFVVPRYGEAIIGGAEAVARQWALRLGDRGHSVSVFTTCATDHHAWANALPSGQTHEGNVVVTRFPVTVEPDAELVPRLFRSVRSLPPNRQYDLLRNTGLSQPLLNAIEDRHGEFDALIFAPYLYPSTALGSLVAPTKSLIMPTLHDEERARVPALTEPLAKVAGLLFLSEGEAALAQRLVSAPAPGRVVGTGVDVPDTPSKGSHPFLHYVAYIGRREGLKNYPLLVEWIGRHRTWAVGGKKVELFAAGSGSPDGVATPRWVHTMNNVSPANRQNLMAGAVATINLSVNESFSLVLMESWLAGAPVIVHADCAVTRNHCEVSGGGLWVRSAEEFSCALDRLASEPALRARLGVQGRDYVRSTYSWDVVLPRIESAIEELAA